MGVFDLRKWKNLSRWLGFPAWLNLCTGEIFFKDVKPRLFLERKAKDLERVWAAPITKAFSNKTVHRIYRYVGDSALWRQANLKLDITVVLPGFWRKEYVKTTGHYHLPLAGKTIASPDFYQLVYGKGIILIQRADNKKIVPYVIYPKLLQPVFIPPEYAHSTINIGKEPVIFQNICTRDPHLNYEPILERGGMLYFLMQDKGKTYFSLNPCYQAMGNKVEKIRCVSIWLRKKFLEKRQSFYALFQHNAPKLKFLNEARQQAYVMRSTPIVVLRQNQDT